MMMIMMNELKSESFHVEKKDYELFDGRLDGCMKDRSNLFYPSFLWSLTYRSPGSRRRQVRGLG